jgi:hypothetical protein
MLKLSLIFLFCSAALASFAAESGEADYSVWNEAVDKYAAGDYTNALVCLKRIDPSGPFQMRVAELSAKINHILTYQASSPAEKLKLAEAASRHAQTVLREKSSDARVQSNFAKTVKNIPAIREQAEMEAAVNKHKGKAPGSLLAHALYSVRDIMKDVSAERNSDAKKAIEAADEAKKRMDEVRSSLMAAGEVVRQAVTNEQSALALATMLDESRKKSKIAVSQIEDMDSAAYSSLLDVENSTYSFFKLVASPEELIREDYLSQSNAWGAVEKLNARDWQKEAHQLTKSFIERFPKWAEQYIAAAAANTNMPPFKAEDKKKIEELSNEVEKLQSECIKTVLPPKQKDALDKIEEIMKLMPNRGGSNQNSSSKNQQQQNKQQQQQNQKASEEQNKDEQQPKENENKAAEQQQDKQSSEAEDILRKAKERTDEYESEKKARMRKVRPGPNERDW